MSKVEQTRVLFNKPICFGIEAPAPKGRPTEFSYQEISSMCRLYETEGWAEKAVVVLRGPRYKVISAMNWGIVIDLQKYCQPAGTPYRPIKVRWVENGVTTTHWPEDLILLHKPLSLWEIENEMDM